MKEILKIVHDTIYQFFDVCDDEEEIPMSDKDKLLLEVNKAICNNLKALVQPCEDCISRQAVNKLVDELARAISDEKCHIQNGRNYGRIMHDILELPSVEPEKCGDCMTVEAYRTKLIDAFHKADHDELIALVALPTEKDFEHLEWLLKTHYENRNKCRDCISRQAAIIALAHNRCGNDEWDLAVTNDVETVKKLPSVEPERNLQPTCNQLATDCISRQAVEKITWEEPSYTDALNVLTEVREKVRALPPVTARPKVGKWITTRTFMHDGEFYCDKCKCDSPNNEKWDYCPNCGAKMEVDK